MFDIAFSELLLIGIVALLVIGPERLPKVARTMGHLLGRLRRYVADVKEDIGREVKLDELRKLQKEMQKRAGTAQHVILEEAHATEQRLRAAAELAAPVEPDASAAGPGTAAETPSPPQLGLDLEPTAAQGDGAGKPPEAGR